MAVPIVLVQGDITRQRVDAIVNAANSSLLGGGGVDGAIHRAGGPEILADCRHLRASHYGKGLPTGRAVAAVARDASPRGTSSTPSGPSGPPRRTAPSCSPPATARRCASPPSWGRAPIAFPAISTGVYRWPVGDAARIAIRTVREAADLALIDEVRFVLFDRAAHEVFAAELAAQSDV
ncbi:O-acetyl-ADP-ribose deacetylase OS=Streptomyces alboniger OX=132473 GN=CP975_29860 PE=4 SV=1 [Streptomyces alboniger]